MANRPPASAFSSTLVEIIVGSDTNQRTFHVHKDVLCHYSTYFAAALNGSFLESHEHRFTFDDDDPDLFEVLVHWLYTRHLDLRQSSKIATFKATRDKSLSAEDQVKEVNQYLVGLTGQLWILADKRGVRKLTNAAITELYRLSNEPERAFPFEQYKDFIKETTQKSKLRAFMVASFIGGFDMASLKHTGEMPAGFYVEVIRRMGEQGTAATDDRSSQRFEQWRNLDRCTFHDHEEGEECDVPAE